MKRKHFLFVALLLAAFLLWHFRPRPQNQQTLLPPSGQTEEGERVAAPVEKSHPQLTTNQSSPEEVRSKIQERIKEMEIANERANDEWRTPIEFYGKVVDENNIAIEGAQIKFSCNDLSSAGTSYYNAVSDANGLFSIGQIKGKLLVVRVSKEGYYPSKRDNKSFYYAGQNVNFVPAPNNPIVFHLLKKGNADPLIVVSGRIKIPLDGTRVGLNLTTGKLVSIETSDIQIECVSDYQNKNLQSQFDWKLQISVRQGGIIQSENEFDFEAPENGYQPKYELEMPVSSGEKWGSMIERKFILKLANGNYARMSFFLVAYNGVFRFESFLNPTGSRNLEYDETIQPKQTVFE